jgi:hypothetical protein
MNLELNDLKDKISRYSDDMLIAMTTINASDYKQEMIDLAKAELEKRGISLNEEQILFDVMADSENYAGRLILIGEELLFLSTGMNSSHAHASGGLIRLVQESNVATRSVISQKLDFSAIDNPGSWAYFIDEITDCQVSSSWFSGSALNVAGKDQTGNLIAHSVKNDNFSANEFTKLKLQIEDAKHKLKQD